MRLLRRRAAIITRRDESGPRRAGKLADRARYAGRMSPRAPIVAALLIAVAATAAMGASAATPKKKKKAPVATVLKSRHLWATVNVCDPRTPPPGIPDTIGVRASMPGAADGREVMYMRFRVQFFGDGDHKWHNVTQGGDSGWTKVGLARYKARQSGRNFRLAPPPGKTSILLRGKVNFEWRLKGETVRQAVELTRKGHKSSAGSYPAGHTAAECTITT